MRHLKTILFLILFLVIPVALFLAVPRLLKINRIECQSQYGPCSDTTASKLLSLSGESLSQAEGNIKPYLSKNPSISSFSLQYNFPDIIKVSVLVRKLSFALSTTGGESVVLADSEGLLLDSSKTSTLPTLITQGGLPKVGGKVDDKVLFASKLLYGMFYLYGTKTGTISEDSLTIGLSDGVKIIFPLTGDKDVLLGAARLILSRLNNNQDASKIGNIKEIDLRFKNPVLR